MLKVALELVMQENTLVLCNGKYLMFDWFGFNQNS